MPGPSGVICGKMSPVLFVRISHFLVDHPGFHRERKTQRCLLSFPDAIAAEEQNERGTQW
jgi:hypothetical protein